MKIIKTQNKKQIFQNQKINSFLSNIRKSQEKKMNPINFADLKILPARKWN